MATSTSPADGPLLTVRDVADRLQQHRRTVEKKIRSGELRSVRLGTRTVRVRPEDLDAYLATQQDGE